MPQKIARYSGSYLSRLDKTISRLFSPSYITFSIFSACLERLLSGYPVCFPYDNDIIFPLSSLFSLLPPLSPAILSRSRSLGPDLSASHPECPLRSIRRDPSAGAGGGILGSRPSRHRRRRKSLRPRRPQQQRRQIGETHQCGQSGSVADEPRPASQD